MENLLGKKFARLLVVGSAEMVKGRVWWWCECDCGTRKLIRATSLKNGNTKSCGCYHVERRSEIRRTHGMAGKDGVRAPEYKIWASMRNRCSDPKSQRWHRYGGRGIKVCDAWNESFDAFFADMGPRPGPDFQIDRINNDGNYEPGNTRWISRLSNSNNRSDNRVLTLNGTSMTVAEWSRETGLKAGTILRRIDRSGWSVERALTEVPGDRPHPTSVMLQFDGRTQPLQDWAREIGVQATTIHNRLRNGWSVERALSTPVKRSEKNMSPDSLSVTATATQGTLAA